MKKLAIFIFLIFLACPFFKKEEEVMPLEVGNWWAYQVTSQGQLMRKEFSKYFPLIKSPSTYTDTLKIIGKQKVEDVDGFVGFSTSGEDTAGIFYYKNDYLWQFYSIEEITIKEKKFPQKPKIGAKWTGFEMNEESEDWDGDGTKDSLLLKTEYSIVMKENITVPAGSFKDTYRTQIVMTFMAWLSSTGEWETKGTFTGTFWIKPNVGMVKMETYSEGQQTQELTGYKLK